MSMFVTNFNIVDIGDFLDDIDQSTEILIGGDGKEVEAISVEALARLLNSHIEMVIEDISDDE